VEVVHPTDATPTLSAAVPLIEILAEFVDTMEEPGEIIVIVGGTVSGTLPEPAAVPAPLPVAGAPGLPDVPVPDVPVPDVPVPDVPVPDVPVPDVPVPDVPVPDVPAPDDPEPVEPVVPEPELPVVPALPLTGAP